MHFKKFFFNILKIKMSIYNNQQLVGLAKPHCQSMCNREKRISWYFVTAAMSIICMTTDSDGYHTDMKFKRNVLYHFLCLKVIPQKTKFNIECLLSSILLNKAQAKSSSMWQIML